jgi:hypothetical protein
MSIIKSFTRPNPKDAPQAPPWFWDVLNVLSDQIDDLTRQLQGRLSVVNEDSEIVEINVANATAEDIFTALDVKEVSIQYADIEVDSFFWEPVGEGQIQVTVGFVGSPATATLTRFKLRGS